ncbi:septum formation inhibitor Maf [Salipaludibacillus agaradhaerens]|jgi:septum formation protein|uniref:Maf family protein n=1 Tax=Salipaludibacillus agaradhaerens TaxID=76935 RepID=UPI000998BCC7|nr:Maf family protein [Salipaludibacillus agaradhaerens]MCR6107447.1 septum formation inhibitor Maf [Salipaludibacillus agaradhaerens]MCR6119476.1 septum formation inhibitor Maf [Salipaludibacillus agaradhaerens]
MKSVILASQSPRRRQLLEQVNIPFSVVPSSVEEIVDNTLSPADIAMSLAKQKADEVFKRYPESVVIGADTIVVAQGRILEKPSDVQEAYNMLQVLSDVSHSVVTGVTINSHEKTVTFYEETIVHFYPLTHEEIERYVSSGEPFDKAGAYGIQGLGAALVKKIEGDYFTVVGLPIAQVVRTLKKFDIYQTSSN